MPTVINGTTGVSQVQDNTITSAKIVDASVTNVDLLTANGIGYKAGDGGSVTQLTSKSTVVTLNKPCGVVTTTADALASGASVIFALNNSLLSQSDVVVCCLQGQGSNYRIETYIAGGGVIGIRITNLTAGVLSEVLVINFIVIKAVGA